MKTARAWNVSPVQKKLLFFIFGFHVFDQLHSALFVGIHARRAGGDSLTATIKAIRNGSRDGYE